MPNKIAMADPFFSADDRKKIHAEVDRILDTSLSMGPNVRAFEEEFADRVGVRHAIAMNACTSALEASLLAHNISGREVIIPAETFIATGMAVHLAGGIPVFAEISDKTLCLDLEDIKKRVSEKTAGIILVHMSGLMVENISEFRKFCDQNKIFLIEDAAHSPGARVNGKEAGAYGHAGCFSFFPTKVITAGEGGMLTTNDDGLAEFVRSFQNRGRDMQAPVEQYAIPGRNVRMTEMAALLGRIQLGHLDEYLDRRRAVADIYKRDLTGLPGIKLIQPKSKESSSFWKLPLLLNQDLDREKVTERMANVGISVDWAYQPALHLQPVFKDLYGYREGMLPKSEDILSRHLCLPCHPRLTDEDAAFVAEQLRMSIAAKK